MLLSFLKKISIYDKPSRPPSHVASVTWDLALGTRPSKSPSFGTPRGAVLAPVFCKAKKDYISQEAGEKYKTKALEMVQVTVLFHTDDFFLVFQKQKKAPKTAPRVQ